MIEIESLRKHFESPSLSMLLAALSLVVVGLFFIVYLTLTSPRNLIDFSTWAIMLGLVFESLRLSKLKKQYA